jgi:hypothetical protein
LFTASSPSKSWWKVRPRERSACQIPLPTEGALGRLDARYRKTQARDGGWSYSGGQSTPTMTCAGILGLITAAASGRNDKGKPARPIRLESDPALVLALNALATTVGDPVGDRKDASIPKVAGRTWYFLWSLERVCVGLDLKVLGKKDWYEWGAEILVANQGGDGAWRGEFAGYEADTCFGLLFLKRANFLRDLTPPPRATEPKPAAEEEKDRTRSVEAKAAANLRFARDLIDSGMVEKGIERLKEIVKEYPGTPSGAEAKTLLRELGEK